MKRRSLSMPPPVEGSSAGRDQRTLSVVSISPPPPEEQCKRETKFAGPGEKRNRYHLPDRLESGSPVGFRTRVSFSTEEAEQLLPLLSLDRPSEFVDGPPVVERELFEESSLGVLSSRQSTNFRGFRQVTFGPKDSERLAHLMRGLHHRDAPVLDNSAYTHVVLTRPYRTPFTFLLTFIGHSRLWSGLTVPLRAWRKLRDHQDDIPTIGYLQQLHTGILADALPRATVIASLGKRRAQVHSAPFCSRKRQDTNKPVLLAIEEMCGLTVKDRGLGWRVALVSQVGFAPPSERVEIAPNLLRRFGANLLAFRSERIQPGINAEPSAPAGYQTRQQMDVPEALTEMAGRAAYNAFHHWTGIDRERAKELLLLERIDVLTPAGKERLRSVREQLERVTDTIVQRLPLWADLGTLRSLSENTKRGKKAFALAGQRIYIGGLSRREVEASGLAFEHALRAFGAAASRSALYCELMGVVNLPETCDLLAGVCLMAGPVNQNDIGKQFYQHQDLLAEKFPGRDPTSLLVWTLKAKTIADPVGNEEQLLNAKRKGALVDLRAAPHEVVSVVTSAGRQPMRARSSRFNQERAFSDVGNFTRSIEGTDVPGNPGQAWPELWGREPLWVSEL